MAAGGYGYPGAPQSFAAGGPQMSIWGPQASAWGASTVVVTINAYARGLPKMDGLLGKCDSYFIVKAGTPQREIFKSEVQKSNLNPTYNPFKIDVNEVGSE